VVRVIVMAHHNLVRQGLRAILQAEPDITIVGEVREDVQAVSECLDLNPDVVLLDMALSNGDGLKATRALTENSTGIRVLILAASVDPEQLRQAMVAGASGYELLDTSPSRLAGAIRAVHKGDTAIDAAVLKQMAGALAVSGHPKTRQKPGVLTQREQQVLKLVAQGLADKEIAAKLLLSEATVKSHMRTVFTKLHAHNRAQAVVVAMEQGVFP
jgi:DNA-binding NarL/FixJ family response regulator